MKLIVSIISSLLVGLTLGASNFSPLMELQRFLEHRKKVLYTAVLAMTAFIFLIASVILASIEGALQYQVQGSVMWTPLMTVAAAFLGFSAICGIVAKSIYPLSKANVERHARENKSEVMQALEYVLKSFVANQQKPDAPAPAHGNGAAPGATARPAHTPPPHAGASDFVQH